MSKFVRHIDTCGYGATNPIMDESDVAEALQKKITQLVRAGNAMLRAETPIERVHAIHDWQQVISELEK